jgi:copper chaperone CopZ
MKNLIILFMLVSGMKGISQSNGVVTATLLVKGNCEQCKKRIENAADIKGVKLFEWNEKTQVAKVIYNSDKTNLATIEKAIAAKGYDTEHEKASGEVYNKLPNCCRYRDAACPDKK